VARRLALTLACLLALTAQAEAKPKPAAFPAPAGCDAVALADAAGRFCVNSVLVTQTTGMSFTVTDHETTRDGRVAAWGWALGPLTAGQVVTLWGEVGADGALLVDRWIERTHAMPGKPYELATALDISRGRLPENRMAWSLVVPFVNLPQSREIDGDGDVHVQTMIPCPSAGLTTELVPPLISYVDSPYRLPGPPVGDDGDPAKIEMREAPPVGTPIVVLGGTRYDTDYGWWELHPIRAWHFPTAEELRWAAGQCARDPLPHLDDQSLDFPVPFGAPSCGHSPVEGDTLRPLTDALGFEGCKPICKVVATALNRPETLEGPCDGIKPVVTRSQEPKKVKPPRRSVTRRSGMGTRTAIEPRAEGEEVEHINPAFASPGVISAAGRAYCAQPAPPAGTRGDPFAICR
jgi:hypothetical protein